LERPVRPAVSFIACSNPVGEAMADEKPEKQYVSPAAAHAADAAARA